MGRLTTKIVPGDWTGVAHAISRLDAKLNTGASPTFLSIGLTGLTASRLLSTDSNKILTSADLYAWVTGTPNQVLIADDGDGTITFSTPQDIHTGASPTFAGLTVTGLGTFGSLIVDTDTLVVDAATHRVGIGTASPGTPLHINRTGVDTTPFLKLTGTGSFPDGPTDEVNGVAFALIYNAAGNRQFWIGDSSSGRGIRYQNSTINGWNVGTSEALELHLGSWGGGIGLVVTTEFNVGIRELAPETLLEMTSTAPYLTLHNSTEENGDGGGESRIIFKREDGAGTETVAGQIEVSHDGAGANDQLGKMVFSVNTGAGLVAAQTIDSTGDTVFAGAITTTGDGTFGSLVIDNDGTIGSTNSPTAISIDSNGVVGIGVIRFSEDTIESIGGNALFLVGDGGVAIHSANDGDIAIAPDGIGIVNILSDVDITDALDVSGISRLDGGVGVGIDPATGIPFNAFTSTRNGDYNFTVKNSDGGTAARASFLAESNSGLLLVTAHGSGRTVQRWGGPIGSTTELLSITDPLCIGTLGENNLILGTNSLAAITIAGANQKVTLGGDLRVDGFIGIGKVPIVAIDITGSTTEASSFALTNTASDSFIQNALNVNGQIAFWYMFGPTYAGNTPTTSKFYRGSSLIDVTGDGGLSLSSSSTNANAKIRMYTGDFAGFLRFTLDKDGIFKFGDPTTDYIQVSATGILGLNGSAGLQLPHMHQSDSTDQVVGTANVAQVVTFNTDVHHFGITRTSSSRFTILKEASYLIAISAVCHTGLGQSKDVEIWLRINGNDVANTNTILHLNSNDEVILAVTFIQHFDVNDYFEFWMTGEGTAVELHATPAVTTGGEERPACPSIIMTCNYVGVD